VSRLSSIREDEEKRQDVSAKYLTTMTRDLLLRISTTNVLRRDQILTPGHYFDVEVWVSAVS